MLIVQCNKTTDPTTQAKELTMYQTPEQLIAMNKANVETALRFAGVALDGVEKLIELQMKTAKSALADSIQSARALTSVRDFDQLAALKETVVQPSIEKATAYAKEVYDVATETQADLSKLVEEQVSEFNKQMISALDQIVKTAPAGSEVGIAAMPTSEPAGAVFTNWSRAATTCFWNSETCSSTSLVRSAWVSAATP